MNKRKIKKAQVACVRNSIADNDAWLDDIIMRSDIMALHDFRNIPSFDLNLTRLFALNKFRGKKKGTLSSPCVDETARKGIPALICCIDM